MMNNLSKNTSISDTLKDGLKMLGFISEIEKDSLLFFTKDRDNYSSIPEIWFQLEKASLYKADAVFFKKGIKDNDYIAQVYIYDSVNKHIFDQKKLTEIHKNIWTGGYIPIACIFTKTEIKILDTTKPIVETKNGFSPEYLIENLKNIAQTHNIYNQSFAKKIKAGTYWDDSNVNFSKYSAYSKLTDLLRKVIDQFILNSGLKDRKDIVQKLIIQCILVKYLEERRDKDNNRVFPPEFFKKYNDASQFSDVLADNNIFALFEDLNDNHFNGGIFEWKKEDLKLFDGKKDAFSYLSKVLRGYLDVDDQQRIEFEDNFSRLYNFNFIPVELISRLYEEFIIKDEDKEKGVAYTPAHLVRLLVNEVMPVNTPPCNIVDFKVLDPACGSAIFLVVAFKRIVEWWRIENNYNKPTLDNLKVLLKSVYGIDLDPKAVQISIFSLCISLCDELSPKEIWNELKFDKLEEEQIFTNDFFIWKTTKKGLKFDVIIGNPPFKYDQNKNYYWSPNANNKIGIPRNQIALRFLSESLDLLKQGGMSCLIVKSSPLLYINSKIAKQYLEALITNFQVDQIFDFTPLARNGVLWDGADVDTAAIFVRNAKPDFSKNILHAIFRRNKANTERIYFEIDKYDLHFILRNEAYEKSYIYKINLLGGGRISTLIDKCLSYPTFEEYLQNQDCSWTEGFIAGNQNTSKLQPHFLYEMNVLPTFALNENGIDISKLETISRDLRFRSFPKDDIAFKSPNILIKKNVGNTDTIPIYFNQKYDFAYKDKIMGVYSNTQNINILSDIYDRFINNMDLFRFFILATSAQALVTKNTALLKEDIGSLPFPKEDIKLSAVDSNVINDVLNYTQYFIRRPESAEALNPLNNISKDIAYYGTEFTNTINKLYADTINSFKLTHIIHFKKEGLLGALFAYDREAVKAPQEIEQNDLTGIDDLINFDINVSLSATRIIQYYAPNKVLFVKPNQKRYWLSSIAYRDADSVFADIINNQ